MSVADLAIAAPGPLQRHGEKMLLTRESDLVTRPADWWVLDLPRDPTPGDPYEVRSLARRVGRVSDDAERAARAVRGLASGGSELSCIGLAGDVFRGALEDFPSQLDKLTPSYEQCSSALTDRRRCHSPTSRCSPAACGW